MDITLPKEDLSCRICCDIYDNPHFLAECNHTFCWTCINKLDVNAAVTCPLCRRETSLKNARQDFKMQQAIDIYYNQQNLIKIETEKGLACGLCEHSTKCIQSYCFDCNKYICVSCDIVHNKSMHNNVKSFGDFKKDIQKLEEVKKSVKQKSWQTSEAIESIHTAKKKQISDVHTFTESAIAVLNDNKVCLEQTINTENDKIISQLGANKINCDNFAQDIEERIEKINAILQGKSKVATDVEYNTDVKEEARRITKHVNRIKFDICSPVTVVQARGFDITNCIQLQVNQAVLRHSNWSRMNDSTSNLEDLNSNIDRSFSVAPNSGAHNMISRADQLSTDIDETVYKTNNLSAGKHKLTSDIIGEQYSLSSISDRPSHSKFGAEGGKGHQAKPVEMTSERKGNLCFKIPENLLKETNDSRPSISSHTYVNINNESMTTISKCSNEHNSNSELAHSKMLNLVKDAVKDEKTEEVPDGVARISLLRNSANHVVEHRGEEKPTTTKSVKYPLCYNDMEKYEFQQNTDKAVDYVPFKMCLINNEIWIAGRDAIYIHNKECELKKKITQNNIKYARALTNCDIEENVVVACVENKGLHQMDYVGQYKTLIAEGSFSDVCYFNKMLYALDYEKCEILCFRYNHSKWESVKHIELRFSNGDKYDRLCVQNRAIYVSSWNNHCLYILCIDGQLQGQTGKKGKNTAGEFLAPLLCQVDRQSNLLVADRNNRCIQLFQRGEWYFVKLNSDLGHPVHVLMDVNNMWVTTHKPDKLLKFVKCDK